MLEESNKPPAKTLPELATDYTDAITNLGQACEKAEQARRVQREADHEVVQARNRLTNAIKALSAGSLEQVQNFPEAARCVREALKTE